jgi:hypothetical protein
MTTTINAQKMTRDQIAAALEGKVAVTDGVSGIWEPACFLAALDAPTGYPMGDYDAFTAEEWAEEERLAVLD